MTTQLRSLAEATENCETERFGELLCACAERNAVTLLLNYLSKRENLLALRNALCGAAMCGKEQFEWHVPFETNDWLTQLSFDDEDCVQQMATLLRAAVFGAKCDACLCVEAKPGKPHTFVFTWCRSSTVDDPVKQATSVAVEEGEEPKLLGITCLHHSARQIRPPTTAAAHRFPSAKKCASENLVRNDSVQWETGDETSIDRNSGNEANEADVRSDDLLFF